MSAFSEHLIAIVKLNGERPVHWAFIPGEIFAWKAWTTVVRAKAERYYDAVGSTGEEAGLRLLEKLREAEG